jgi:DNA integrity scanning protein DisA with diadenylate cyclase activity
MGTETDAVSVVISEETGNVTVFFSHKMKAVKTPKELEETLRKLFEA